MGAPSVMRSFWSVRNERHPGGTLQAGARMSLHYCKRCNRINPPPLCEDCGFCRDCCDCDPETGERG